MSAAGLSFLIAFLLPAPKQALAQQSATLQGFVYDAETREPLIGANVSVLQTYRGSSTNSDGEFVIHRIQPGKYVLRVSYIGYETRDIVVRVSAHAWNAVAVSLTPGALQFDEIIVTASRQEETARMATASVSVLTRDTALRRNSLRLDRALESIPGVNMMGENVNIRNSTGYTRGLGSRVLMLLDGMPVLMSDFGNMNWDILPVTDIETVEVVKGPASAIYGSFALGGVMNIITRAPSAQPRLAVRATAGIYDEPLYAAWDWTDRTLYFNRVDASYSRRYGDFGLRVSASRHESTGDRVNKNFLRWNGSAKVIWTLNNRSQLTLFGAYARDRRGEFVWSRFDHPYRVDPEFEDFRLSLDAFSFYAKYEQQLRQGVELRARASYIRQLTGNQFKVPGDFKPAQGPGAAVELHAALRPDLNFIAGAEVKYDAAEQRHFGRHSAVTLSGFLHQTWEASENLRLTAGLRFDHYRLLPAPRIQTQFVKRDTLFNPLPDGLRETYFSPQSGISFEIFPGTVLHAAFGSGIRIPSIAERFMEFKVPIIFLGNANLRTEESRSLEIGWRQSLGGLARLEFTAFSNTFEDLIEPAYVSQFTGYYATLVNIDRARIRGVELAGWLRLWRNRIEIEGSLTWTEPLIVKQAEIEGVGLPFHSGDYLSYRPSWIGYVSPAINLGRLQLAADFGYASRLRREQVQVFKDDQRVPKKQLDVRASYRFDALTVQLIIRNLPQYNYTQIERNMNEVRNFAVALHWNY